MTHTLECAACGYMLRGLTLHDRCPECGHLAIDSHRIATIVPRRVFPYFVAVGMGVLTMFAVLLVPRTHPHLWKSKSKVARAEVASIAQQLTLYLADGNLGLPNPNSLRLSDLTAGPDPYLRVEDLVDPWGRPYMLMVPGPSGSAFSIVSYGGDGVPGGKGEDADIVHEYKTPTD